MVGSFGEKRAPPRLINIRRESIASRRQKLEANTHSFNFSEMRGSLLYTRTRKVDDWKSEVSGI